MIYRINNTGLKILIAIFAGIILTLAFAPFHIWPLAAISPAILYYTLYHESTKRSALLGWLYGLGFFGSSISWVYVSVATYGPPNKAIAVIITVLFIAALSIFFLLLAAILTRFYPHESLRKRFIVFPTLWILLEVIRSKIFTGFPWVLLGESQTSYPISGFLPIFGVYITSFICVIIGSLIFSFFHGKNKKTKIISILSAFVFILLGWSLQHINWTKPKINKNNKIITENITLVQGNIPETDKWDPNKQEKIIDTYLRLSEPYLIQKNQIIIWPETAIPVFASQAKPFLKLLNKVASHNNNTILSGIPMSENGKYYNGALAVGSGHGVYLKQHLVPFGEYMPMQKYLSGILDYFSIPMSNFTKGPANQSLFSANNSKFRMYNCFESAFPELVAKELNDADFIATISDDSWFGDSLGPKQHEQIRQTRAQETGRFLVSTTNNGMTSIINPKGIIIKKIPPFTRGVLHQKIDIYQGSTPWVKFGMLPTYILILCSMLILLIFKYKKTNYKKTNF